MVSLSLGSILPSIFAKRGLEVNLLMIKLAFFIHTVNRSGSTWERSIGFLELSLQVIYVSARGSVNQYTVSNALEFMVNKDSRGCG